MAASTSLTPEQRTMRARLAAHALHAKGGTNTAAARKAFDDRFEKQVDPDGVLPVAERMKRAKSAKSAYMTSLSLRSSMSRKKFSPTGSGPSETATGLVGLPTADDPSCGGNS